MILGRLFRVIVRNPFGVLAAALVAASWGTISVNAVWLQTGPHPAPYLDRGKLSQTAVATPAPRPQPRVSAIEPGSAEEADRQRLATKQMVMLRDLQIELAKRNYYHGAIDGQYGPQTEAAIRSYQTVAGLAESGQPTDELLAHVRLSAFSAPPMPAPSPLRAPASGELTAEVDETGAGGSGDTLASLLEKSATASIAPAPLPVSQTSASPDTAAPAGQPPADPRIEAVQSILADLGYAPGSIDGNIGPSTKRAIEDFEVDRGLPMTGQISPALLKELTAVSGVPLS